MGCTGTSHPYPMARIQRAISSSNLVDDITGTFLPIVMIAHAISYYRRFRERELRSSQLESQLANAHLQALKSKLQPHFLFNTLHSISALMHKDVQAADTMMSRLGDLLRMSLESDGAQETSVRRELEFVNAYLEVEAVRFGDRLVASFRRSGRHSGRRDSAAASATFGRKCHKTRDFEIVRKRPDSDLHHTQQLPSRTPYLQ